MSDAVMSEPIWLSVARMLIGLREVPGPQSNPVILQWARDIHAPSWYHDDDQAWCAVGMNRLLLACQLPMSGAGFELLRAKSFERYGQALSAGALGAIMVFARPEGGHVGLYLGERPDAYFVWGANQGNAVSAAWIAKSRLTAIRWPPGMARPAISPVLLAANGSPLSDNEA